MDGWIDGWINDVRTYPSAHVAVEHRCQLYYTKERLL